ncbi:uncharacterized protein J4E88_009807 [Alternaria novae-zelandiae]|uniref:uncharacterized protein n=1 Tax=Alternaria novae-zelandiae TaxID=430562 RepID=UPI0020C42D0B|nr:uncharacterized protein J4E88_009807 [Alternaria novae-zelandiae]KAI4670714.1 hypothetical protein J4E88_009807 [Alternaria novae-zelandiae]
MAKKKALVISGPMDAKHVGGVNVLGGSGASLNDYFHTTAIQPDERPSHTFVATGKTEVPRRADTVGGTLRRSSVSLSRSLSKLRRNSSSHHTETAQVGGKNSEMDSQFGRSGSTSRPLRKQSSISRLRQRVGLDHELYDAAPKSKPTTPEPRFLPELAFQDDQQLRDTRALARLTTTSSIYSTPDPGPLQTTIVRKQVPLVTQRRPSPLDSQTSNTSVQPPARTKRVDSGTAIDLKHIPVQERPIPFKEIMAVPTLDERMAMYKKTREYWAHAEHGLVEWTARAAGPKAPITRS